MGKYKYDYYEIPTSHYDKTKTTIHTGGYFDDDNKRQGIHTEWYSHGQIRTIAEYCDDQMCGAYIFLSDTGDIILDILFDPSDVVSKEELEEYMTMVRLVLPAHILDKFS